MIGTRLIQESKVLAGICFKSLIKINRYATAFVQEGQTQSRNLNKVIELKKKLEKGPDLKDFIKASADPLINQNEANKEGNDEEELITNLLLLQGLNNASNEDSTRTEENRMRKVFYEIHGCQMNFSDIEIVNSILVKSGKYEQTNDEKDADVILIMTCSIRENAEQKIWNRLKDFVTIKQKSKPHLQIGILGCMAERLKEKIVEKQKKIDVIAGPDSYKTLPYLLDESFRTGSLSMNVQLSFDETYSEITPMRINSNAKTAFVSIQRGCDNMCSFCIVPFVRGRERSRKISSIIEEVKYLSDIGIKEVTLLGQNVNSYLDQEKIVSSETSAAVLSMSKGFTTIYKPKKTTSDAKRFVDLLDEVSRVNPEMRIRFTSPHPKDFPNDLLDLIKERANICKTIHLPAQSGNSECLSRMRRGYTREAYLELVANIKSRIPDLALTSDFIAGFCGETETEHQETISLMNIVKYTYCFVYSYSMREKTRAYHRLKDDVPQDVKNRRYMEIVDVFRRNAHELNSSKIGQVHLMLIDQVSKRSTNHYSGRNDNNTLVIIPKVELPYFESVSDYNHHRLHGDQNNEQKRTVMPQIGDYIACRILSATSQSMKAEPLFACKLQTFDKIKNSHSIHF